MVGNSQTCAKTNRRKIHQPFASPAIHAGRRSERLLASEETVSPTDTSVYPTTNPRSPVNPAEGASKPVFIQEAGGCQLALSHSGRSAAIEAGGIGVR